MGGKPDKKPVKPARTVELDGDEPRVAAGRSLGDWTYHGIGPLTAADDGAHILVEVTEFGPTERQKITVLRELAEPPYGFHWGYNGGGPGRAAAAILADALSLGDPDTCGIGTAASPLNTTLGELRFDFCWDVLTQFCAEWRMRRGAILRWVRGWYAEHGFIDLPQAAVQLPPAYPHPPAPRRARLPGPAASRLGPLPTLHRGDDLAGGHVPQIPVGDGERGVPQLVTDGRHRHAFGDELVGDPDGRAAAWTAIAQVHATLAAALGTTPSEARGSIDTMERPVALGPVTIEP
jgi:hypothetical protein